MWKMRAHPGTMPSSCAPSSSSSATCFSSRVPRSSALPPPAPPPPPPPCRSLRLLLRRTMSHCCPRPPCTSVQWEIPRESPRRSHSRASERVADPAERRTDGWTNRSRGDAVTQRVEGSSNVASRGSRRGTRVSDELSSAALLQQSKVHARSRPGRGADGCRATAVGGAFGRAYSPATAAPRRRFAASTVRPSAVDGRNDDAELTLRRRRPGWRPPLSLPRSPCDFPLLRKQLSHLFPAAIAAGVQFTAVAACRMFNPLLSGLYNRRIPGEPRFFVLRATGVLLI